MRPKVSVVGLGKLGSPLAALFAYRGLDVVGYDSNPQRIVDLASKAVPLVSEAELEGVTTWAVREPVYTNDIVDLAETDITFVVVPTPSNQAGDFNIDAILEVCSKMGSEVLKRKAKRHTIIITSTVMPGHTYGPIKHVLEASSGLTCRSHFGLAYHPEFIALGDVMRGMTFPDFLLVGTEDPETVHMLRHLYELVGVTAGMYTCAPVNAEIAKLMINAFVTAKISYANLAARICEGMPGGDAFEVTMAMGKDHRIGLSYLKGGVPYGGPCFPRDNRALAALCCFAGTSSMLPLTVDGFNNWQFEDLLKAIKGRVQGRALILGTSYKIGTDVREQAFGDFLVRQISGAFESELAPDPENYDTVVIALPIDVPTHMAVGKVVIDCWRSSTHLAHVAKEYIQLGRFMGPVR